MGAEGLAVGLFVLGAVIGLVGGWINPPRTLSARAVVGIFAALSVLGGAIVFVQTRSTASSGAPTVSSPDTTATGPGYVSADRFRRIGPAGGGFSVALSGTSIVIRAPAAMVTSGAWCSQITTGAATGPSRSTSGLTRARECTGSPSSRKALTTTALRLVTRCCSIGTLTARHRGVFEASDAVHWRDRRRLVRRGATDLYEPRDGRDQGPDLRRVGQRHPRGRLCQARLAVLRRGDGCRLGRHDNPHRPRPPPLRARPAAAWLGRRCGSRPGLARAGDPYGCGRTAAVGQRRSGRT